MLRFFAFVFVFCASPAFAEILKMEKASVPAAHGMFVKSPNEIWLSDTFKKLGTTSNVYDQIGNVAKLAASGKGIAGISKHPSQELYSFCDVMGSQVQWLDASGKKIYEFSVANPWNARWTPSGNSMFVVTYEGTVERVFNGGNEAIIISDLDAPFDVAPISETELWVSEQGAAGAGKVCQYAKSASSELYEKIACNKDMQLENPEGLWPLADGSVVVVDTAAGTLVKIEKDGSSKILADKLGVPILVQVLEQGKWVVFTNQSSVGAALIFGQSKELL